MALSIEKWREEFQMIMKECMSEFSLEEGKVLVIGCSTSEIAGERIGTSGSMETAEMIFSELTKVADEQHFHLAFQCCEHLNRALVVDRAVASKKGWEEVSVVPAPHAGGSMATYAFQNMKNPVVVEFIAADAGIDIGDTLIGMHLKHVAVPVRINQKNVGNAHISIAYTRPKMIGGERAIYN